MFWEVVALIVLVVVLVGPFFESPRDINRRRTKLHYGGKRTTEDDRLWR